MGKARNSVFRLFSQADFASAPCFSALFPLRRLHASCPIFRRIFVTFYLLRCKNPHSIIQAMHLIYGIFQGKARYDLLSTVVIRLGNDNTTGGSDLIRLLRIIFSHTMKPSEKIQQLKEQFGIKTTEEFDREVTELCNLSDLVEERAIQKGMEKGLQKGIEKLASAIRLLKQGATKEDLLADGIDEQTVNIALQCLA